MTGGGRRERGDDDESWGELRDGDQVEKLKARTATNPERQREQVVDHLMFL